MVGDIVSREIFRMLAEDAAKRREQECGAPCLETSCPRRRTKEQPSGNVVQFRARKRKD